MTLEEKMRWKIPGNYYSYKVGTDRACEVFSLLSSGRCVVRVLTFGETYRSAG
jgi:hypothetical protein